MKLIRGGEEFFNTMQSMIDNAHWEIHLQTYILDYDNTGKKILECLCNAALRGVKVFVLLDFYGSLNFIRYAQTYADRGLNIRFFGKIHLRNLLYAGRRLHHKILCTDRKYALIGGINISDKYYGTPKEEAWLDFAFFLQNDWTEYVACICEALYYKEFYVKYQSRKQSNYFKKKIPHLQIIQNDWLRGKNEIYLSHLHLIHQARKSIIIVHAYFLPGRRIRRAIRKASQRGVQIKILFGSLSDVYLFRYASMYFYRQIHNWGIEIYEWKKSVVHAKAMLVDNNYLILGSFNINMLSQFGSIETDVLVQNHHSIANACDEFNRILENSVRIFPDKYSNSWLKIKMWISFFLIRSGLKILTIKPFYSLRRKKWKPDD